MNKKAAFIDVIIFFFGVLIITLIQLFSDYQALNFLTSTIFAVLLLTFDAVTMLITFKKDRNFSIGNIVFSIILAILFTIFYCIPIYSFFGTLGVNNSVYIGIVFYLLCRCNFYRYYSKPQKKETGIHKKKFLSFNDVDFDCLAGVMLIIVISVIIIGNTIQPVFDVSYFLNKIGLYRLMGVSM